MLASLKNVYGEHDARMCNGMLEKIGCGNTNPQKQMAIKGLLRVQIALQCGINIRTIKHSFRTCGIYPYSLQKMLSNCSTKLTTYQELNIVGNMSELVKRILRQGELFDKDFEDCSVPIDRSGAMNDHLVINRRRSILFTNPRLLLVKRKRKLRFNWQRKQDN